MVQAAAWEKSIWVEENHVLIVRLVLKYRPGDVSALYPPIRGSFNVVFRVKYKDGSSACLRIPRAHVVHFPEEKLRYEVALVRYIKQHTTIPVPTVYHFGTAEENPIPGAGPFMVMEYIDNVSSMAKAMRDPTVGPDVTEILNLEIDETRLEHLYGQVANILLQLYALEFPRIGSLVQGPNKEDGSATFSISGRPLTFNMQALVMETCMPLSMLPNKTYTNSKEWYSAVADMHLWQLAFQRNDAVEDEGDGRDAYVGRQPPPTARVRR